MLQTPRFDPLVLSAHIIYNEIGEETTLHHPIPGFPLFVKEA